MNSVKCKANKKLRQTMISCYLCRAQAGEVTLLHCVVEQLLQNSREEQKLFSSEHIITVDHQEFPLS
jgi:hypothetical protein